ncbi:MAG: dTDP-4-dehydrorhamnose reductase [Candidatus Omnitrophota bacterium]|nr:dTDP-4-dehydrorhamnose reductase [Candidatus Omnitrophota bacterium]
MEKIKNKILITGAAGMLGSAIVKAAQGYEVYATDFKDLDITEGNKVKARLGEIRPQVVIHAAAYTDVDGCEKNPQVASKVNVEGTRNIAEACREVNANLIFISTDYVFDGNKKTPYAEEDAVNPLGVYGKTKAEAEEMVCNLVPQHLIIRSSFLFGKGKKGFVESILKQAREYKTVKVVCDKYGTPTYVNDLAAAIIGLVELIIKNKFNFSEKNILHITNSGFCPWIEYAQKAIEFAKIKGVTILPVRLKDFPFKARRPVFSVLDNSRYKSISGELLRPWQSALKEYIECMNN